MTPAPTSTRSSGHEGLSIATEGSGDDPRVVFVHANGFCKELWRPIADLSTVAHRDGWVAMDQRGHGDSERGAAPYLWDTVAHDVVAITEDLTGPLIGVGHSSGGAAVARAEVLSPGRFSKIVLIEPILFPPPHARWETPLAAQADRRRASFVDREAAFDRFSKGLFASWEPPFLDLYVDHGFRQTDDGWTLKCPPAVEADYFREGGNVDTFDRLGEIECPAVLVTGENSDSHQEPYLSLLASQFKDAAVHTIAGASHFAPMEESETVAGLIDAVASH